MREVRERRIWDEMVDFHLSLTTYHLFLISHFSDMKEYESSSFGFKRKHLFSPLSGLIWEIWLIFMKISYSTISLIISSLSYFSFENEVRVYQYFKWKKMIELRKRGNWSMRWLFVDQYLYFSSLTSLPYISLIW